MSDLSDEEDLSDEAEDQSPWSRIRATHSVKFNFQRTRKSSRIQGNEKPASSIKTLKSRPNKSAAKSKYLEPSESSDSESEEDSEADSNYEEPLPKVFLFLKSLALESNVFRKRNWSKREKLSEKSSKKKMVPERKTVAPKN